MVAGKVKKFESIFFHQAALGDFVLTFDVIRSLMPPVAVVSHSEMARLAQMIIKSTVAFTIDSQPWSGLYCEQPSQSAQPDWLSGVKHVVSYVSDGADCWAKNIRNCCPNAQLAFVPPRPADDWPTHICDWHRQVLSDQGIWVQQHVPALRRNEDGPIILHPGSGGLTKCWPVDRFAQLAEQLRAAGHRVQVIIGEAEMDRWPTDVIDSLNAQPITTLDELHDTLVAARAYIGNDSGPTHLAAQVGLPTLAMFGPTMPARWSPRGPLVRTIAPGSPQSMDWLTVEHIFDAVEQMLAAATD